MRKRCVRGDRKKNCSKCSGAIEQNRVGQRYCRSCHNEYMRVTRKKHTELDDSAKKKANARAYANVYIKRGFIKRQPCAVCGSEKSQMHHEDYNKPTDVVWLCRAHHLEVHQRRTQSNIVIN